MDQWSETTSHQTMAERSNATRRTVCPSLSLVYRQALEAHLHLHLLRESMSDEVRGHSSRGQAETENPNKNDDNEEVRGDSSCGLPEWQEEFKENLVDESVPEHRDTSSSTHELPSEPRAKVVSGEHSIFTHFPKDRKCDICLRTKITRSSCRRRTGTVVPRAEKLVI